MLLCTMCAHQALSSRPPRGHCLKKQSMPCKSAKKTTINQRKEETEPVDDEDDDEDWKFETVGMNAGVGVHA